MCVQPSREKKKREVNERRNARKKCACPHSVLLRNMHLKKKRKKSRGHHLEM